MHSRLQAKHAKIQKNFQNVYLRYGQMYIQITKHFLHQQNIKDQLIFSMQNLLNSYHQLVNSFLLISYFILHAIY